MIKYWIQSDRIISNIFIPKYYDPNIDVILDDLSSTHKIVSFGHLIDSGIVQVESGNEVGKSSYGTGDIPFVRTSDIANWEIKSFPKQGLSDDIYRVYSDRQDVKSGDILLVKDGTYLIGNNCFITEADSRIVYQSHIYKIRVTNTKELSPEILFLLLNSSIVQRQFRSIQFTADIIDTIGRRIREVRLPIPVCRSRCETLSERTRTVLDKRVSGKVFIKHSADLIRAVLKTNSITPLLDYVSLPTSDMIKEILVVR